MALVSRHANNGDNLITSMAYSFASSVTKTPFDEPFTTSWDTIIWYCQRNRYVGLDSHSGSRLPCLAAKIPLELINSRVSLLAHAAFHIVISRNGQNRSRHKSACIHCVQQISKAGLLYRTEKNKLLYCRNGVFLNAMQKPDVVLVISAFANLKLAVDVAALSGVTGSPGVKQHSQPSLELLACRTCLPEQGESLHLLLLLSCSNGLRQSHMCFC